MKNERLEQLISMFTSISGVSNDVASNLILSTKTGMDIKEGNKAVLYDQQSSNLLSIVHELNTKSVNVQITSKFTRVNIQNAMIDLYRLEKQRKKELPRKFAAVNDIQLIEKRKHIMKQKRRDMLLEKRQDETNIRRLGYANKVKG